VPTVEQWEANRPAAGGTAALQLDYANSASGVAALEGPRAIAGSQMHRAATRRTQGKPASRGHPQ